MESLLELERRCRGESPIAVAYHRGCLLCMRNDEKRLKAGGNA